jgi:poly-gamma-glutamate capsule biosynthesis protein CapA/YwtB (metallophosphatase superfamily)
MLAFLALATACRSAAGAGEFPSFSAPPPMPRDIESKRVVLSAAGDILIHQGISEAASRNAGGAGSGFGGRYDFRPMFDEVRPLLSDSHQALCHMEVPISRGNADLSYFPRFRVPNEIGAALAYAGFDACTTASNHSIDQGPDGVAATLEALDTAQLDHAGMGRTPEEASSPVLLSADGIRIGVVSFTFSLNGLPLPPDKPWMVNLIDERRILGQAQAAREAGADLVVVSMHWGTEFVATPNVQQTSLAQSLLASPQVDLILGHHAHVVQPIGKVGDEFVVYGMGNFISRQSARCCPAATQDGVIVHLHIGRTSTGARVAAITYTPTWVEPGTFRIRPVARALDDRSTPADHLDDLTLSWQRTTSAIDALGADEFGVRPSALPRGTG